MNHSIIYWINKTYFINNRMRSANLSLSFFERIINSYYLKERQRILFKKINDIYDVQLMLFENYCIVFIDYYDILVFHWEKLIEKNLNVF